MKGKYYEKQEKPLPTAGSSNGTAYCLLGYRQQRCGFTGAVGYTRRNSGSARISLRRQLAGLSRQRDCHDHYYLCDFNNNYHYYNDNNYDYHHNYSCDNYSPTADHQAQDHNYTAEY